MMIMNVKYVIIHVILVYKNQIIIVLLVFKIDIQIQIIQNLVAYVMMDIVKYMMYVLNVILVV